MGGALAATRRYVRSRALTPELAVPPDATLVRQRFIPRARREWVMECDRIMLEYGSVQGSVAYRERHHARWKAQSLIRLMVELRVHGRAELREHTERVAEGWAWSVEYLGRDGRKAQHG